MLFCLVNTVPKGNHGRFPGKVQGNGKGGKRGKTQRPELGRVVFAVTDARSGTPPMEEGLPEAGVAGGGAPEGENLTSGRPPPGFDGVRIKAMRGAIQGHPLAHESHVQVPCCALPRARRRAPRLAAD